MWDSWHGRVSRATEPQILFPLVAVVLLAVIWGTTLSVLKSRHADAERAGEASSQEQLDTYEAQVLSSLHEIDRTLNLVAFWPDRQPGRPQVSTLEALGLLPPALIFTVRVVDRRGIIVESTAPIAPNTPADPESFRAQREGEPRLFAHLLRNPGGVAQLQFSRRLDDPSGAFDGMTTVTVDADFFVSGYEVSGYEPARLGEHGVLGLVGTDGVFRAGRTGNFEFSGIPFDYGAVPAVSDTAAVPITASSWDGVRRWTRARALFDYPLAVVVGLSVDEQMAGTVVRERSTVGRATPRSSPRKCWSRSPPPSSCGVRNSA